MNVNRMYFNLGDAFSIGKLIHSNYARDIEALAHAKNHYAGFA